MASTLICKVRNRLPFAQVSFAGTLDRDSMARMLVELRDCLADLPTALIIDAKHLAIAPQVGLTPLVDLVGQAIEWPRASTMWCAAPAATVELLRSADRGRVVELCPAVDDAVRLASQLPVPARMSVRLAPDVNAPAKARSVVDSACARFNVARASKLAQLLVSELVTNAVVHARTAMTITVRLAGPALQIVVRDLDPRPMHRPAPPTGLTVTEQGRGLLVLDAMADGWGTLPTRDGKAVWAEVIMT